MIIEKILKPIWNEFVYGGHLLSFGAVSIVLTSAILLNIKITWDCVTVVYLGTLAGCLYGRYREFNKDILTNLERSQHLKKYIKKIPLIIFLSISTFVGILLYFNRIFVLFFSLLLILLIFSYDKFLKKFTKKIVGFKNFFTSLIFSLLVILLAAYYSVSLNLALVLILIFVYFREFVGISFSDIKDIDSDKKEGLRTLAIVFGQEKLIKILSLINILAIIPIIIGVYLNLFPQFSIMLLLTVPYTFYYFKKLEDKNINPAFLYNVLVDTEDILWLIYLAFGKVLL
ncbi:MAG: UbiA family prenyltransferase [Candidatus Nealsonbacteria bacterium]|nr:UbiA family prenyltransferase [Candidatus Nealsonbacteria bacterium]